mmetsp:Transcript_8027/g.18618  ORF Transcript_8027/g.18618 Transcript_8027/m.18618 type:complete len:152 (+) Transcript_8027:641-1096(+)|eukprot:CAMPEP_0116837090 /NCGR_PEP_ID=MMETSP0418-20121206/8461_1 /TAXON_ID=1158023 /ORGANISM="Astrosyne radiata, Strain 13vi08-1A" /LENGTH=151 /DNA_ID=CAMNT_0004466937 /DNA_START=586 /DNA_END=1041 /DNA_ORIENTATION=-
MEANEKQWKENVQIAKDLVQDGKADEMMPRSVFFAPITARRFLDLQDVGGADDFFSSDFSDQELSNRLSHVTASSDCHVLVAFSGKDEYVAKYITNRKEWTERLCRAMHDGISNDHVHALYLPNANHNLSQSPGDGDAFVNKVGELLKQVE